MRKKKVFILVPPVLILGLYLLAAGEKEKFPAISYRLTTRLDYMDFFHTADINGDGLTDIVGRSLPEGTLGVYFSIGDDEFLKAECWNPAGGEIPDTPLDVGDGDNDGRTEILANVYDLPGGDLLQNWEWTGEPENPVVKAWELRLEPFSIYLAGFTDLDDDGDAEISVVEKKTNMVDYSISVYEHVGDGEYKMWAGMPASYNCGDSSPVELCVMDYDADGRREIVILMNSISRGGFQIVGCESADILSPVSISVDMPYLVFGSGRMNPGDIDGDGKADLLLGIMAENCVSAVMLEYDPGSAMEPAWGWRRNGIFWKSCDAAVGDADGDGIEDDFLFNSSRKQVLFIGSGDNEFSMILERESQSALILPRAIDLDDMDKDGLPEIIIAEWEGEDGDLLIYEMVPNPEYSGCSSRDAINPILREHPWDEF